MALVYLNGIYSCVSGGTSETNGYTCIWINIFAISKITLGVTAWEEQSWKITSWTNLRLKAHIYGSADLTAQCSWKRGHSSSILLPPSQLHTPSSLICLLLFRNTKDNFLLLQWVLNQCVRKAEKKDSGLLDQHIHNVQFYSKLALLQ